MELVALLVCHNKNITAFRIYHSFHSPYKAAAAQSVGLRLNPAVSYILTILAILYSFGRAAASVLNQVLALDSL